MTNSKKLLSLLLLAIFLFSAPAYAELKKIDRRGSDSGWTKQTGYYLFFVARDYLPTGHAFVVWAERDRVNNKWRKHEGFGLYPAEKTKDLAFGSVPGKLRNESIRTLKGNDEGLAVAISKKAYDYSRQNINAVYEYPPDYSLLKENCVHFTDLIARAISLNTPEIEGYKRHPQGYIDKLKSLNN